MQKIESTLRYSYSHSQSGGIKLAYLFPMRILALASMPLYARFDFLQLLSFFGTVVIVVMWIGQVAMRNRTARHRQWNLKMPTVRLFNGKLPFSL